MILREGATMFLERAHGFEPTTALSRRTVEMATRRSRIAVSPCFGLSNIVKTVHRTVFTRSQVIRPCRSHNREGCSAHTCGRRQKETSTLMGACSFWLRRQDLPSTFFPPTKETI